LNTHFIAAMEPSSDVLHAATSGFTARSCLNFVSIVPSTSSHVAEPADLAVAEELSQEYSKSSARDLAPKRLPEFTRFSASSSIVKKNISVVNDRMKTKAKNKEVKNELQAKNNRKVLEKIDQQ